MSSDRFISILYSAADKIGHRFRVIAKVALTIILISALAYFLDVGKLIRLLRGARVELLVLAAVLSALFVTLRVAKWITLTRSNGLIARRTDVSRLMLASLVAGMVTPARVGETLCVACFKKGERSRAVFLFFYDRVAELTTVLILAMPGTLLLPGRLRYLALAAVAASACVFGIALFFPPLHGKLMRFLRIDQGSMTAQPGALLSVPLLYWILCLAAYVTSYLLIAAFVIAMFPAPSWLFVLPLPIITLSNLISVTVGGLGVREGLAAAILPIVGIPPEVGASALFLSFVFTRVAPGAVGLAWTMSDGKR